MTPGTANPIVVGATPLGDLDALVRARDAYRDLVDEEVVMAVERARAAGASWGQIAQVIISSDYPLAHGHRLTPRRGPRSVPH